MTMKRTLAAVVSLAFTVAYFPGVSSAQTACPMEVETAKTMLKQKQMAARAPTSDKEVQAPRTLAGARVDQQLQAPRSGDQQIQAPRSGDQQVQAPRSGDQQIQAPRSGDQQIQAPRSGDRQIQAPRTLAGARVNDPVQAPRSGDQQIQAPRAGQQQIQAPRSGDQQIQAPRSGDQQIQAPRTLAGAKTSSADFKKAASLIKEAESACKVGNSGLASEKAKAAMELMNK
jgi:hypothetical protein